MPFFTLLAIAFYIFIIYVIVSVLKFMKGKLELDEASLTKMDQLIHLKERENSLLTNQIHNDNSNTLEKRAD